MTQNLRKRPQLKEIQDQDREMTILNLKKVLKILKKYLPKLQKKLMGNNKPKPKRKRNNKNNSNKKKLPIVKLLPTKKSQKRAQMKMISTM